MTEHEQIINIDDKNYADWQCEKQSKVNPENNQSLALPDRILTSQYTKVSFGGNQQQYGSIGLSPRFQTSQTETHVTLK